MANKLFNNPRPVVWLLSGVIILFLVFWSQRSDAQGVTRFEMGPTVLSGELSDGVALLISETWNDRYLLGFGLIGEQTGKFSEGNVFIGNNLFVRAQLLVNGPDKWAWAKNIELGIGPAYFQNTNRALGSHFTINISIAFKTPRTGWLPDRYTIDHFSNAGTASPNSGQDIYVAIGYDFK